MAGVKTFDVVVVGAGASGCVVAARLAKAVGRSVLLIEAGPDLRHDTPSSLHDGWQLNRDFYWSIQSETDELGSRANIPRCSLVGGTSWMTRFAVRGSPADFDEWVGLGNPGWSFDDVLPFFNRIEADSDFGEQPYHGSSGPIPVDRYLELGRTEVHDAAVKGIAAIGFPAVDDHNRPGALGVGPMPMSSVKGRRVSTADAYLPGALTPGNLVVISDTLVARVLFERSRAIGVQLADGKVIEAGWVVIAAGVFGSPSLLMRSGIGPADHLRSLEIAPLIDLPGVGENLADHPGTDVDCGYDGPGRSEPILHSIATFHSPGSSADAPPDLMLWVADPIDEPGDAPAFVIDVVLLKPESRGSVRLRSADAQSEPLVELPRFRHGPDLDRLVEGFQMALEVANGPEMASFCHTDPSIRREGTGEIREAIRHNSWSVPHFVGTCSMGLAKNRGAVVDEAGRVHDTERLSVVDASIIPIAPSGFTHIPTIMIAERLGEALHTMI